MKYNKKNIPFILFFVALFSSCEDETTTIGSVISAGEVIITVDSINYQLNAKAIRIDQFDSKTGNLMIGNLQIENYGNLTCSFVTRLMSSANLEIPDSIFGLDNFVERVDSCKLIMGAKRNDIVGDSLAPQKMTVYKLTEQLPSNIDNNFNPEGYYDPAIPFATKSYTVSGIAQKDSAFYNNNYVEINVDLPISFGREIFSAYKNNPSIFQWPQTMAKEFLPGLYVKSTFGNGCVANITTVYVGVFYHTLEEETTEENDEKITTIEKVNNIAIPFTVSPEVLSSNNISYQPSENIVLKNEATENNGEVVITTPGGYIAQFSFPAEDLLERYKKQNIHLSTINDLILYIPGESFDSSTGIGVTSNMLLIKKSEYEDFFANNKVPDNKTSFIGVYNASAGLFQFTTLRNYFIDLLSKVELSDEDIDFYLVPVDITTESSSTYYSETTYVTKCIPLTSKPTMTLLNTNEATIAFSFSTQIIE